MDAQDDLAALERALRRAFGRPPRDVLRLTTGASTSRVYQASLDGHPPVVVKVNAHPPRLAGMAHNLEVLGDLGLPVPQVLHVDIEPAPGEDALVVMSAIPGRDLRHVLGTLSRRQMHEVARAVVDAQRKVGTRPEGRGYGWVPEGAPVDFARWTDVIERDWRRVEPHWRDLQLPNAVELPQQLEALRPYFSAVPARCFLDDLTTKNVMIEGGALAGFVDFDVVCYGDPLYWLALTRAAVRADVGEAGRPYLEALERLWALTAEQRRVARLYERMHLLNFWGHAGSDEERTWVRTVLEQT